MSSGDEYDAENMTMTCDISSMNIKSRSKDTLKPKATFKWVLCILFQKHHQKVLQVKLIFLIVF